MDASLSEGDALPVASRLLENFVVPEVLRQLERRELEADGEKFAQAAQRCLDGAVEAVEEALAAAVAAR